MPKTLIINSSLFTLERNTEATVFETQGRVRLLDLSITNTAEITVNSIVHAQPEKLSEYAWLVALMSINLSTNQSKIIKAQLDTA